MLHAISKIFNSLSNTANEALQLDGIPEINLRVKGIGTCDSLESGGLLLSNLRPI
jgi:hypothetical protein